MVAMMDLEKAGLMDGLMAALMGLRRVARMVFLKVVQKDKTTVVKMA